MNTKINSGKNTQSNVKKAFIRFPDLTQCFARFGHIVLVVVAAIVAIMLRNFDGKKAALNVKHFKS